MSKKRRSKTSRVASIALAILPPIVTLVVFGVIWQIVAAHNTQAIPALGAIVHALVIAPHFYLANSWWTIEEMLVGLVASAIIAFTLAVLMTQIRVVARAVMPLAIVLNVTPVVSFAPGLVLIFGFSMVPRYIVTGIIVFFPFLVNSFVGLRSIDQEALDFFTTLDASRSEILLRLRLPSSLPYLFAAARIGVPLSLVGAVVAEFTTTGNSRGLGFAIDFASSQLIFPEVYASVFCLAVIGVLSTVVVVLAERRFLRWHATGRA